MRVRSPIPGGLALLAALAAACGGGDANGPRTPAAIVVRADSVRLAQGERYTLDARVVDRNGRTVASEPIRYRSSDTSRVQVNEAGELLAPGAVGPASIEITAGDLRRQVGVTVTRRFVGYRMRPDSIVANPFTSARLSLSQVDYTGIEFEVLAPIYFQSGDPAITQVDDAGQVFARTVGRTSITVLYDTVAREIPVTVRQIPARIEIAADTVRLRPGQGYQLPIVVRDLAGFPIAGAELRVSVEPADAFAVTNTGLIVTTLGAPPRVGRVTVRSDTVTGTIPVYVGPSDPMQPWVRPVLSAGTYDVKAGANDVIVATLPSGGVAAFGTLAAGPGSLPGLFDQDPYQVPTRTWGAAFGRVSGLAYLTSDDGLVVVDRAARSVLRTIRFGGPGKFSVVVSPDERRAWVGGGGFLWLVDLAGARVQDSVAVPNATFLALDPAGTTLYQCDDVLREFDAATLALRRTLPGGRLKKGLAVSPDGSELYVADEVGNALLVFSAATGALLETVPLPDAPFDVAVSSARLAISTSRGVRVLDRATRFPLSAAVLNGTPRRLGFSPDGAVLLVANQGGWVDLLR